MLRGVRDQARALGDRSLEAATTADLERMGIRDEVPADRSYGDFEMAVPERMEYAVPRKAGRPKLPRCEHDRIIGRCEECD